MSILLEIATSKEIVFSLYSVILCYTKVPIYHLLWCEIEYLTVYNKEIHSFSSPYTLMAILGIVSMNLPEVIKNKLLIV